jgi:hypothetical protein|tara:strand:+ start:45 stop:365 length:321 start_codon:yes stop_codon:yes gene_type:complete
MPNNPEKLVQDLILFYVKENYNIYLQENNLTVIDEDRLDDVIDKLYSDRKEHLKEFIKTSLKKIMGEDYVGDLVINNMLIDIFRDDLLCKNRIKLEINEYQKTIRC